MNPQTTQTLRFRHPVDQAGFARLSHLIVTDPHLSDGAVRLYAHLLSFARQKDACWPGRTRLATDLHTSTRTIDRRLHELIDRGLISRQQRLNTSAITWIEPLFPVYSNPVLDKYGEHLSSPNMANKEETKEETHMNDGDVLTTQEQHSLSLLTDLGVTHSVALHLARTCSPNAIAAWTQYTKQATLTNPPGFLVAKLQQRDPPPASTSTTPSDHRRQYLTWAQ